MKIDNRRDILLLLLYSPGKSAQVNQPFLGRTKLVKMLFLFKKEALKYFRRGTEITEEHFYAFVPWHFGPFSAEVYDDLNFFELCKFICRKSSSREETTPQAAAEWAFWLTSCNADGDDDIYSEYQEEEFVLTEKGCEFVEKNLYSQLSRKQAKLLKEFRSRIESAPLRAVLKYVCERYPSVRSAQQGVFMPPASSVPAV